MKLEVKNPLILSQISDLLKQSSLIPVELDKDNLHLFYHVDNIGQVIGIIGVELYSTACLLRSLTVREDKRNQGIARNLLKEAFEFARILKSFEVYLLTQTIENTMQRYGFRNISRESVPKDMLQSPFFQSICPLSSKVMYKNIMEFE